MVTLINRVLGLLVASLVAAALFVAGVTVWSWWEPADPQIGDASRPVPTPNGPVSIEPAAAGRR